MIFHSGGPAKVIIRNSDGTEFEAVITSYTISQDYASPLKRISIEAVEDLKLGQVDQYGRPIQICAHQWKKHSGLNAIDSTYQGLGQSYSECKKCGAIK